MEIKGVLAGLGNPGPKYHGTRHNTGFMVIDRLVDMAHLDGSVSEQNGRRFNCELWRVDLDLLGGTWLLVKPLTFMNLSGDAIQPLLAWHRLETRDLVVVHDELDLPPGSLRFKLGGGNAGHNGLKSITQRLATPDFYRLRLGIGRPQEKGDVTPWVLGRMPEPQNTMWRESMEAGIKVLSVFARLGLKSAVTEAAQASRRISALHEELPGDRN